MADDYYNIKNPLRIFTALLGSSRFLKAQIFSMLKYDKLKGGSNVVIDSLQYASPISSQYYFSKSLGKTRAVYQKQIRIFNLKSM